MEIYFCYSMRQAGFLMMNGCRLLALESSKKKERAGMNNFLFKKTPELLELLDAYAQLKPEQEKKKSYN